MIIYKTTNLINGKIYIGKDLHNKELYLGSGIKLLKAIKKYGKNNFKKELLEVCENEQSWLDREIYWIKYYQAIDPSIGYNIAEGGSGGNTRKGLSLEQKQAYIDKMQQGRRRSDKVKASYKLKKGIQRPEHSRVLKELYASGKLVPHNLGKPTSEEVRQKISKANKGRKLTEEQKNNRAKAKYKSVSMFLLDGSYVQSFPSIKHATEACKIGRDSIYGCCIGKYKQGGGFVWKYV